MTAETMPTEPDPYVCYGQHCVGRERVVPHRSGTSPAHVTLYKPRHRRDCGTDWTNTARCSEGSTRGACASGLCPHHAPQGYADHMARHAKDSLR